MIRDSPVLTYINESPFKGRLYAYICLAILSGSDIFVSRPGHFAGVISTAVIGTVALELSLYLNRRT